ncbi:MAG TPA: AMP-binding protein, partial [Myxococcaceae bacterium]|nr:AMP-binding protein [Myxococcaceae bacterium]
MESDREKIADWNSTGHALSLDRRVHELVHVRASERPDAPAVVSVDRTLTYGELDRAADRVAAQLQRVGAGPDVVVGLYADRSPEMVVG